MGNRIVWMTMRHGSGARIAQLFSVFSLTAFSGASAHRNMREQVTALGLFLLLPVGDECLMLITQRILVLHILNRTTNSRGSLFAVFSL
jgi:hypothetical protein